MNRPDSPAMECICCGAGENAVITWGRDAANNPFIPDDLDETLSGPPVVSHVCQVCGYRWQELYYPGPRGTVVAHDLSNGIPFYPTYRNGPGGFLATREASDLHDDGWFSVNVEPNGLVREEITQEQFDQELSRRQNARRAAICN